MMTCEECLHQGICDESSRTLWNTLHGEAECSDFKDKTKYVDADALPITKEELLYLMNDTISYIWSLEDRGLAKPEFGYDDRKALLDKLKNFANEHFPEWDQTDGEI